MTNEELWLEIERVWAANEDTGDAMTTREIGDMLGLAENATRVRVRALVEAGRMEPVRARRVGMNGVEQPVWAYRLKP